MTVPIEDDLGEGPDSEMNTWQVRRQRLLTAVGRIWPVILVLVAAFAGVVFYNYFFPPPLPLTQQQVDQSVVDIMASATPPPAYSAQVYQIILPSLVLIQAEQTAESDLEEDGVSVGTGVVVNEDGDILTALHVVAGATDIHITFADGTEATASIISAEPQNDIAVLHPSRPPELLVPAVLGNPNAMRVGDETYAVGNPLGLAGSMSAGVISGFDRTLPIDENGQQLEGLIQFDAAVNPGNSGGPLLNRNGQVIGIVTALVNPTEQNFFIGIGFAVPIGTAVSAAGGPPY